MSGPGEDAEGVLGAAARLVDAFARFDKAEYFACFRGDASFVFYNSPIEFSERARYEREWDEWVRDGWRVLSCTSTNPRARMLDRDTALFAHEVHTTLGPLEESTILHERETIIFCREAGGWLAVHEHLSSFPV